MQEWYILGVGKGVLFREVSSVQECPHREREVPLYYSFHCILYTYKPGLRAEGVPIPGEGESVERHRPDLVLMRQAAMIEGSNARDVGKQRGYEQTHAAECE